MQANLLQPSKKLHFSEEHFQGFWVQLLTLVRRNEHADAFLDGILHNPMRDVADAIADNANANHLHAVAVRGLYSCLFDEHICGMITLCVYCGIGWMTR